MVCPSGTRPNGTHTPESAPFELVSDVHEIPWSQVSTCDAGGAASGAGVGRSRPLPGLLVRQYFVYCNSSAWDWTRTAETSTRMARETLPGSQMHHPLCAEIDHRLWSWPELNRASAHP